ncbi:hypothetical protein ACQ4WX_47400 [Streptomyces lasalocidi]
MGLFDAVALGVHVPVVLGEQVPVDDGELDAVDARNRAALADGRRLGGRAVQDQGGDGERAGVDAGAG